MSDSAEQVLRETAEGLAGPHYHAECLIEDGPCEWELQVSLNARILREREEAAQLPWRQFAWLIHGHQGLYGDDGEMQCQRFDFKRHDAERLIEHAVKGIQDAGQRREEAAFKAGAEAMREQAVEVAEMGRWRGTKCAPAVIAVGKALRALPLPEMKP